MSIHKFIFHLYQSKNHEQNLSKIISKGNFVYSCGGGSIEYCVVYDKWRFHSHGCTFVQSYHGVIVPIRHDLAASKVVVFLWGLAARYDCYFEYRNDLG